VGSEQRRGPYLAIAGWTVALEVEDEALRASLSRAFKRFQTDLPPMARVEVTPPAMPRAAPAVRALPEARRGPEGELCLEGEDYAARISEDGRRAWVTGAGSFPVETTLKLLLALELARRGGLLVHGVGVEHLGHAALWVGPSGAGKSTLASLWRAEEGTVLADELVAVWPGEGGWWAAGTPWNVGLPREAVLRVVGVLGWEARSRWEPASAGEVARVLLLNALLTEASAAGRSFLLGAASRLLASVRTARLVFAPDASVVEVLRKGLSATG
jgi:hypothetical protein